MNRYQIGGLSRGYRAFSELDHVFLMLLSVAWIKEQKATYQIYSGLGEKANTMRCWNQDTKKILTAWNRLRGVNVKSCTFVGGVWLKSLGEIWVKSCNLCGKRYSVHMCLTTEEVLPAPPSPLTRDCFHKVPGHPHQEEQLQEQDVHLEETWGDMLLLLTGDGAGLSWGQGADGCLWAPADWMTCSWCSYEEENWGL